MTEFRHLELFWNQIMMEHAQFIRGLLDPTECRLIESADEFANRLARDPRTWKVFSSKVHGDPAQV